MPVLTATHIRALLPHTTVPDAQADLVIDLVYGWLKDATGNPDLPDDYTDEVWSAALELAALVVSNPESLSQRTAGPTSQSWPMASRRDAILARVRGSHQRARSAPTGSFPPAPLWPDPLRRFW
jgi:hypothetical protein